MAKQFLVSYIACCLDCKASVDARNALAWAHNHSNKHQHKVELSLGYFVRPNN